MKKYLNMCNEPVDIDVILSISTGSFLCNNCLLLTKMGMKICEIERNSTK